MAKRPLDHFVRLSSLSVPSPLVGEGQGEGAKKSKPAMSRELTVSSVAIGLALAVVMGAANVYLGLKVGMTVSASIPAAVLSMLLLRLLHGPGRLLEANQAQTAASAGESLAAGIIFTMPALVLVGAWQRFDPLLTTLVALAGGLLGVVLMIPMRRVFVARAAADLPFPEGVACAAVLRSGTRTGGDGRAARQVAEGVLFGLAFKGLAGFAGLFKGTLEGAWTVGKSVVYLGSDLSVALLGVGMIVRLHVAALVFLGGAIGWLVALPLLSAGLPDPIGAGAVSPVETAYTVWSQQVRYLGVGAMLVGGLAAIVRVRRGLAMAVRALTQSAGVAAGPASHAREDLPPAWLIGLALACVALIGVVYVRFTGRLDVSLAATAIMLIAAFFFTAVASYIVGLVGNSNSPVSGMTITTVLFTGVLLLLFGFTGSAGMVATLGVAAIVCCTACTAGDVCNDLKTGVLVGATPRRQQLMQVAGVAVAACIMAPVLQLLHDHTPGGIGGKELTAPQAQLFASLARGFFGDAPLPWSLVGAGALIGLVLVGADALLERRQARFRLHPMPVAVGMYLPLGLSVPMLLGGILSALLTARHPSTSQVPTDPESSSDRPGVLLASGAIAGEALMGVGLALLASLGLARLDLGLPDGLHTALSIAALLAALLFFHRRGR